MRRPRGQRDARPHVAPGRAEHGRGTGRARGAPATGPGWRGAVVRRMPRTERNERRRSDVSRASASDAFVWILPLIFLVIDKIFRTRVRSQRGGEGHRSRSAPGPATLPAPHERTHAAAASANFPGARPGPFPAAPPPPRCHSRRRRLSSPPPPPRPDGWGGRGSVRPAQPRGLSTPFPPRRAPSAEAATWRGLRGVFSFYLFIFSPPSSLLLFLSRLLPRLLPRRSSRSLPAAGRRPQQTPRCREDAAAAGGRGRRGGPGALRHRRDDPLQGRRGPPEGEDLRRDQPPRGRGRPGRHQVLAGQRVRDRARLRRARGEGPGAAGSGEGRPSPAVAAETRQRAPRPGRARSGAGPVGRAAAPALPHTPTGRGLLEGFALNCREEIPDAKTTSGRAACRCSCLFSVVFFYFIFIFRPPSPTHPPCPLKNEGNLIFLLHFGTHWAFRPPELGAFPHAAPRAALCPEEPSGAAPRRHCPVF